MTQASDPHTFHKFVDVETVTSTGLSFHLRPDEAERARLAAALDLVAVDAVEAELLVRAIRKTWVEVSGRVKADVQQTCVVTLKPVGEHIEEEIAVRFAPVADVERELAKLRDEEDEIVHSLETRDPPDVIENGQIDLGAVICDFIALGLNPYPRADDAAFAGDDVGETGDKADDGEEADKKVSPFAALAALKSGD